MHNKVVYRIARGLRKSGAGVLRFNYRGVNLSEGEYGHGAGEVEDAKATLAWLRERYPDLPYSLAGFSFGSRIVLHLGCADPGVRRVVAVGFPTTYKNRDYLSNCRVAKIFVHSTRDEHGPMPELEQVVAGVPDPKTLIFVEAEDHFFKGALDDLEKAITGLGLST
jgi:uncharacterized protein